MIKKWIDPNEIYVHDVLNNRERNPNYIEELAQSMTDKGFLPEFPIDVFKASNLANIDTALPYVCACGAHRTLGAINAKLDTVLVHIHDGREEAFVEMMHLDNFQFDPAQHSGIGQPFTQKEKRAAVTQLLLLPKFFEMTNTALEELWRIPNSNIRRWRADVVTLLVTDSPKLRLWGVSDGRLKRLRELAKKPERINEDGKIVKIRQPIAEATEDEKRAFYETIEKDWDRLSEETAMDTAFAHVQNYLKDRYNLESRWRQYNDLSMSQLQKIHREILSKDPEFMAAVFEIAQAENRISEARAALQKAHVACTKAFNKVLAKGLSEYDERRTGMRDRLETFLRKRDARFEGFRMEYYYYETDDRDTPEFCEKYAALHLEVKEGLETDADWLQEFTEKEKARLDRKRKQVKKLWLENREDLKSAMLAYPRDISDDAIFSAAENWYKHELRHNELRSLMDADAPSAQKHLETLEKEAKIFKKLANDLLNDYGWVPKIPVPKAEAESRASIDPNVSDALFFVKVTWNEGDRTQTHIFETRPFQGSSDISELPDSLRQQLVELARMCSKRE